MALDLKYSAAAKNAKLGATGLRAYIGTSAKLRIYSGTKPANPDTAIAGTLLVELTGNATAFGTEAAGVLTASAIANGTAVATGTASHYRLFQSNGTTPVLDGTVGTATSDLILDNTSIATGQVVSVSSFTITEGN